MKTLLKILPWILLLLLIGSVGLNVYQGKQSADSAKNLETINNQLEASEKENASLEKDNRLLETRTRALRDSITTLNREIAALKEELSTKVVEIRRNRTKIADLQKRSNAMQNELNALRNSKNADVAKIKELEDERFALDVKLGDLFIKNDSLENVNNGLVESIIDKETDKEGVEGELDSVKVVTVGLDEDGNPVTLKVLNPNYINVFFNSVTPIQKTNKAAKNPSKWNGTLMTFQLGYEGLGPEDLVGRDFMIQIKDKDSGEILSPRESSAGSQDTKGLLFTFARNPVSVQYVNYQKKSGNNYEVLISFINEQGRRVVIPSGKEDVKFDE
ncbi:MAG: hypothetical protein AAF502_01735 [Bacteroidota bacterium]